MELGANLYQYCIYHYQVHQFDSAQFSGANKVVFHTAFLLLEIELTEFLAIVGLGDFYWVQPSRVGARLMR